MPKIKLTVALIGNPNSGKSTLFNALTGANQSVGNWPGVTVEQKSGFFEWQNNQITIIDLPGVNTLSTLSESRALDEKIAAEYLLDQHPDVIINVIDANSIEHSLFLTSQLLELNIPMIVVLNMIDVAEKHGVTVNANLLEKKLHCPVIPSIAFQGCGIIQLKNSIIQAQNAAADFHLINYPNEIETAITEINSKLNINHKNFFSMRLLEGDLLIKTKCPGDIITFSEKIKSQLENNFAEDLDIVIADNRYQKIQTIKNEVVTRTREPKSCLTDCLDNIFLNRFFAIPIFLAFMYLMFTFAINVGGAFQDFFAIGGNAIFVNGTFFLLTKFALPHWLISIIANGIGNGIVTTLTFIPIIGAMFLFLSILEDSGYMNRATFIMDKIMCAIGLPGKAFVPMIVGFGCNVPAIMAARTLENENDRILTILMTPFMSCSARLAIYAVFVAAFFPRGGQNIVFLLYLIGILVAVFSGFIFRKTILHGATAPLVMEMPHYHLPHLSSLLKHTWRRLKSFLINAGKIIVIVSLVVSTLNNIRVYKNNSLLAITGKAITPIFQPIGIKQSNWPATVGIITGIMAKEVVIGTLNTLYAENANLNLPESQSVISGLKQAVFSVSANLKHLSHELIKPIHASIPEAKFNATLYNEMAKNFGGPIEAFAFLLFILLYFPCAASIAAIYNELNTRWAIFSVCWTIFIAYAIATIFYQIATFLRHPIYSVIAISSLFTLFLIVIFNLKRKTT